MACFIAPAAEAIVTTAVQKLIGKERAERLKLKWLNIMLWGGVIILAVEHIWHGEVVPWPPFLTAMANPADTAQMLHEMATVGTAMAITITLVWALMVVVYNVLVSKSAERTEVTG